MVDLTKIKGRAQQVHLTIQNYTNLAPGNYVGISATDNKVTKSIFLDLISEKCLKTDGNRYRETCRVNIGATEGCC